MNVIVLRRRSCLRCVNAIASERGTYCRVFEDLILDERSTAEDCDVYEPEDE